MAQVEMKVFSVTVQKSMVIRGKNYKDAEAVALEQEMRTENLERVKVTRVFCPADGPKPGEPDTDRAMETARKFFRYSFDELDFKYRGLTRQEQSLCTKEEFEEMLKFFGLKK